MKRLGIKIFEKGISMRFSTNSIGDLGNLGLGLAQVKTAQEINSVMPETSEYVKERAVPNPYDRLESLSIEQLKEEEKSTLQFLTENWHNLMPDRKDQLKTLVAKIREEITNRESGSLVDERLNGQGIPQNNLKTF